MTTTVRSNATWRQRMLLVLAGFFLPLLLGELTLRVFYPSDRLEYVVDDELLWRFRPAQATWEPLPDGSGAVWSTVNAAGFRGPNEFEQRDFRPRLLVLGDSYTWGWGLGDQETYAAGLERATSSAWNVVNGGTPGWGLFQVEAYLARQLPRVSPRIVTVLLVEEDVYRQPYDDPDELKRTLRNNRLRNAVRRASRLVTVLHRLWQRLGRSAPTAAVANERPHSEESYRKAWNRDRERLTNMLRMCRRAGVRLLVVGWPQDAPTTPLFRRELAAWAAEQKADVLDLTQALSAVPRAHRSLSDGHPNAVGHRLTAEALYKRLKPWLDAELGNAANAELLDSRSAQP